MKYLLCNSFTRKLPIFLLHLVDMKNTNIVSIVLIGVLLVGLAYVFYGSPVEAPAGPDETVMCTMDTMECPDGSFVGRTGPNCEFVCPVVEDLEVVAIGDITVASPVSGDVVSSPLVLSGEAKGTWYFEASAPVEILDWQGTVIAQSFVTAQGDWMTTDFVPFTGTITFTSPYSLGDPIAWKQGSLVFKKDNPSALPQNDDQIIIPIEFAP